MSTVLEIPAHRFPDVEKVAKRLLPDAIKQIENDQLDGVFWYYGLLRRAWRELEQQA